jgi:hypothetical protein
MDGMRNAGIVVLLLLPSPGFAQESTGAVKGTVSLRGEVPPAKKVDVSWCKAKVHYPKGLQFLPVPIDGERRVQQCLVFVHKELQGNTSPVPAEPLAVKFDKYQLAPRVAGMRAGQQVVVVSLDEELHNAHALPFDKGNKEFNMGLPTKGRTTDPKRFEVPETGIKLKCDVHPWEQMWITVLPHPFFTMTDEHGQFEIKGLPPGKYTLEAWQENCLQALKEIEVKGTETSTADFELDAGPRGVSIWDLKANPALLKGFEGKSMGIYGELKQLPGYEAPSPPFAKGTVVVSLRTPGMPWAGICGIRKDAEKQIRAIPDGTPVRLRGLFKGMIELDGSHFAMEEFELER